MSSSQPGQKVIKLDQLALQDLLKLKEQLSQVVDCHEGFASLSE